ncbi:MAG: type I 3-dehydroquinate dehydratase [Candidatus Korarchaeota archaeon NZ13-K]|nr:MAG: type I 3-dehydroquinate dehydratase [Candidatus Korarchaeota archaeon NZ13-K]
MRIVVSLRDRGSIRRDMERALRSGADLVELRADLIWEEPPEAREIEGLVRGLGDRVIVTWRSRAHGGMGGPQSREWLEEVSKICGYVDVEYENSDVSIGNAIFSWHDPGGTPREEDLLVVARRLLSLGGIAKVVTLARDELEAYRVLSLYRKLDHGGRLVAFSMGSRGAFSRRLSAALGSPLIYSHMGSPTAEGQLSLEEALLLRRLLC